MTNTLTLAGSIAGSTGSGADTFVRCRSREHRHQRHHRQWHDWHRGLCHERPRRAHALRREYVQRRNDNLRRCGLNINANLNLGATGNAVSLNGGTLNVQAGAAITDTQVFTIGASGGAINILGRWRADQQLCLQYYQHLAGKRDADGHRRQSPFGRDEHLLRKHDYSERRIVRVWYFGALVSAAATFNVNSGGELITDNGNTLASGNAITVNGGVLSFGNGNTGIIARDAYYAQRQRGDDWAARLV